MIRSRDLPPRRAPSSPPTRGRSPSLIRGRNQYTRSRSPLQLAPRGPLRRRASDHPTNYRVGDRPRLCRAVADVTSSRRVVSAHSRTGDGDAGVPSGSIRGSIDDRCVAPQSIGRPAPRAGLEEQVPASTVGERDATALTAGDGASAPGCWRPRRRRRRSPGDEVRRRRRGACAASTAPTSPGHSGVS